MAAITGEHLPPAKISFVDRRHHENHPASGLFFFSIFGRIVFPAGVATMAILAGVAQRRGKETHRSHKLIHGQIGEHGNVLKELAGGEWFLFGRGLGLRQSIPDEVQKRRADER